jgi:small subunit ribosomal protein S21
MPKVVRRENEDLESLLRRFRRQVNDANILGECRKREHFISNGEKKKERKIKKLMAIRKQQAEARREERYDLLGIRPKSTYVAPRGRKQTWANESTPAEQPNVVPTTNPGKPEKTNKPAFYSYRKSAPKQQPNTPKEGK